MGCAVSSRSAAGKSVDGAPSPSKSGRLLEEYEVGETLGEGAFGVVYACTHRKTGREVAVKMVDKVETPAEAIRQEAEMLKSLNHRNIVHYHDVIHERCFVCIVMDKLSGGDLVEGLHLQLKERGRIDCHRVAHIHQQMAAAVRYLHRKSIVHRDIKGDNFLMDRHDMTDPQCLVVLTDFGTATILEPTKRLSAEVGTRIFWAPEVFDRCYGLKVDIWAMGVIIYGLLGGRFPFKDHDDVLNKQPRIPKRTHPDCEDLVLGTLEKDETRRLSADDVMAHPWISGARSSTAQADEQGTDTLECMVTEENVRAEGADDAVAQRRRKLLERLNAQQHGGKAKKGRSGERQFLNKTFTVTEKYTGYTFKFEWWSRGQVDSAGLLASEGEDHLPDGAELDRSPQIVGRMLEDHNINTSLFGKGEAKTLEQLAAEVQSGAARLMLDASDYKKLVRVVDVVLLKIYDSRKGGRLLIETAEQYPDGRRRATYRLPGSKKEPHQSSLEVAMRVLEELFLSTQEADFEFAETAVFEEENESPSFPGVRTVYRKEVVPCFVKSKTKAQSKSEMPWEAKDSKNNVKFYTWMTEAEAQATKVNLATGSSEVSGLVLPPIGMKEEDLSRYLSSKGVDLKLFHQSGPGSLKELSAELIKGESSLSQDSQGRVVRLIDLVVLRLSNPATGELLVHTEQAMPNGTASVQNRLPGAKRRPDESQFLTARRIIRRQLKIDENQVRVDPRNVRYMQEEKNSLSFPGIRTVYRRRLITAELVTFG